MRFRSFTLALLAMAVITPGVALAQSPHFVKLSADIVTGGALDVTWKEAGLDHMSGQPRAVSDVGRIQEHRRVG